MGFFDPSPQKLAARQKKKDMQLFRELGERETMPAMVSELLAQGANPNARNGQGRTPLDRLIRNHYADRYNKYDAIVLLLRAGADINMLSAEVTPLTRAIYDAGTSTVTLLVENGADVNGCEGQKISPLYAAVDSKNWPVVRLLCEAGARAQELALIAKAVEEGAPRDAVLCLVKAGADINGKDADSENRTGLQLAARANNVSAVAYLLEVEGVDINATDSYGYTALMHAARANHNDIVGLLLKAGADAFYRDSRGNSALSLASASGQLLPLKALLGALGTDEGKTELKREIVDHALIQAVIAGHPRLVEILAEEGADLDQRIGEERKTLAMEAAIAGRADTLAVLLRLGADIALKDGKGLTVQDHAALNAKARAGLQDVLAQQHMARKAQGGADYAMVDAACIEYQQGPLSMVFNFFTQQVIYRDNDRSALFVQNFADIQRQEAVTEAYHKLIELGGHPPQYAAFSLPSARPKLSAPRS